VSAGEFIVVESPRGVQLEVAVPEGVQSGETFRIEVPEETDADADVEADADTSVGAVEAGAGAAEAAAGQEVQEVQEVGLELAVEATDDDDEIELEVMCPMHCSEGDTFDIETEYGDFPVTVPKGVEPGDEFIVEVSLADLKALGEEQELAEVEAQDLAAASPRSAAVADLAARRQQAVNGGLGSARNWSADPKMDAIILEDAALGTHVPMASITTVRSGLGRKDAQERLVREVCALVGCDRASIFLIDAKTNELVIHGSAQVRSSPIHLYSHLKSSRPHAGLLASWPPCCVDAVAKM
jgi:hypothetical protein